MLGLRRARAATLMMLALPGSAYLYQGEELGLADHTTLPDDLRQDPAWFRSDFTKPGRDGCRVPMPWAAEEPGLGFSPTGKTWLPQPESYRALAVDRQEVAPGSTLSMYRAALALRREHSLGSGELEWVEDGESVVAFDNGPVRVLTNVLGAPVELPEGYQVLLSSVPLRGHVLPTDTTVWLTRA